MQINGKVKSIVKTEKKTKDGTEDIYKMTIQNDDGEKVVIKNNVGFTQSIGDDVQINF